MDTPKSILMIKAHSLGVGDLLRSSAAWRALHDRYPGVQLHLLFLSKHAGYPTEAFIRDHHLLTSAHFLTIREGHPGQAKAQRYHTALSQPKQVLLMRIAGALRILPVVSNIQPGITAYPVAKPGFIASSFQSRTPHFQPQALR